eukprot:5829940-Alexandrium_andersonii.AAC.1
MGPRRGVRCWGHPMLTMPGGSGRRATLRLPPVPDVAGCNWPQALAGSPARGRPPWRRGAPRRAVP